MAQTELTDLLADRPPPQTLLTQPSVPAVLSIKSNGSAAGHAEKARLEPKSLIV